MCVNFERVTLSSYMDLDDAVFCFAQKLENVLQVLLLLEINRTAITIILNGLRTSTCQTARATKPAELGFVTVCAGYIGPMMSVSTSIGR